MKLLFPVIFSWCYSGAGPLPACYSEQVDGPVKFCFGIFAFKSTFAFKYLLSNRPSPDMFTLQSCLSGTKHERVFPKAAPGRLSGGRCLSDDTPR